jgi:hypothetical protein
MMNCIVCGESFSGSCHVGLPKETYKCGVCWSREWPNLEFIGKVLRGCVVTNCPNYVRCITVGV